MCTRLPCTHLINNLVTLHVFVLLLADEVSRLRTRGAESPPSFPTASHGPPVHRCGRDAGSPDVDQAWPGATAACGRSGRRGKSDIASRRSARGSPARVVTGAATYVEGRHGDTTRTSSLSHGRTEPFTDSRPASHQRRRVDGGRAHDLARGVRRVRPVLGPVDAGTTTSITTTSIRGRTGPAVRRARPVFGPVDADAATFIATTRTRGRTGPARQLTTPSRSRPRGPSGATESDPDQS